MQTIDLSEEEFSSQILEIFNHAILHTTALFEYHPRTPAFMQGWFDLRRKGAYPVIGVVDESRNLLGFASYGPFRALPAYHYTVEHSVYVHPDHRRRGIADRLLAALRERAEQQGIHVMVGVIEAENKASIQLHEKHGFRHCGTMPQIGYKFGRWLDVVFYQLTLPVPSSPSED